MKNTKAKSGEAANDEQAQQGALGVAPGSPLCIQLQIPDTDDKELQALTALVGVMDRFYPVKDRNISDAFEMWRVAEYFHSRYGIKPEHIQN